jgi:hypothetical protein
MKKIGTYTLRGKVSEPDTEAGTPQRIRLFDGRFDTGYKVIDFVVWGATMNSSSTPDVSGKLGTTDNLTTGASNFFNADDVREIAWAGAAGSTDTIFNSPPGKIVDPDNFIVEDLFVYVRGQSDVAANYMVTLEKYETTDSRGALAMVRNNAQNVDGDN